MFTRCSCELWAACWQAPSLKILGCSYSSHGAGNRFMIKALFTERMIFASQLTQFKKKSHQVSSSMFFLCSVFVYMCGVGCRGSGLPLFLTNFLKTVEQQFHLHWSPFSNNPKLLEQSWKTRNSLLNSPRINHHFPTHYVCILLVTIWTHSNSLLVDIQFQYLWSQTPNRIKLINSEQWSP